MNTIYCPQCGTESPSTTSFCPQCGYDLARVRNSFSAADGKYSKASFVKRLLAFLIDCMIGAALSIPSVALYIIWGVKNILPTDFNLSVQGLGYNGYINTDSACCMHGGNYSLLVIGTILWLLPVIYGFVKDGLGKGQSWGKRTVGLMVVHLPSNRPCSVGQSCLRTLVTALVQCIPVIGQFIEPLMVLATDDGRRLADKGADTQVIDVNQFIIHNS